MTHITEFTTEFPGTHVTSWTDSEGQDMVTIGVPDLHTSTLWHGDYEHVLEVWDSLEGRTAPMTGDPLFDALDTLNERLQDEYAMGYADAVEDQIRRDNDDERRLREAGLL